MDQAKVNYRVEEWQIKQIREATNQRLKRDDGGNILTHPEDIKKGKNIKQITVKQTAEWEEVKAACQLPQKRENMETR